MRLLSERLERALRQCDEQGIGETGAEQVLLWHVKAAAAMAKAWEQGGLLSESERIAELERELAAR